MRQHSSRPCLNPSCLLCLSQPPQTGAVADVASLQQPDGSFVGDPWGEVDTRFSFAALLACSILGRMDALDVAAAVEFVLACKNFDGGFGCTPGARRARKRGVGWGAGWRPSL